MTAARPGTATPGLTVPGLLAQAQAPAGTSEGTLTAADAPMAVLTARIFP